MYLFADMHLKRCKNTSLTPAKFSLKKSMWVSKNAENVMLIFQILLKPVGNFPLFLLAAPIESDVPIILIGCANFNRSRAGVHSNLVTYDVSTLFSVQQVETKYRMKFHYKTPSDCNKLNLFLSQLNF
jgi:hypothetical protein